MNSAKPSAVPSPCIGQCRMLDNTSLCQGCWRTLDEIMAWSTASDATKCEIWAQIVVRRTQAPPAPASI